MRRGHTGAIFLFTLAIAIAGCRETRKIKPPRPGRLIDGVLRVVVIGDSIAFGAGDESGKGIAVNLEEELRRRGIGSVEVKNYGVSGATTSDVEHKLQDEAVRADLSSADAIVLSIGANDVFQSSDARAAAIREPVAFAERILRRVAEVVAELRRINPDAQILLLGGYNPIPDHPLSSGIKRYLKKWDKMVNARFQSDPLIDIVKLADIIDGPQKLSPIDHFHPGAAAYRDAAKRIADMLLEQFKAV